MQAKKDLIKHLWTFLLIISAAGIVLDLTVIRHGVGATGDAIWYMQGAENILKGYGYGILLGNGFMPITIFPPFYSIFLAGFGWFGISIYNMAGVLNALLLGVNIYLTGWIIYQLTRSAVASIVAGTFTFLCFDLFVIHTWAMSEPLFLTLTLLSLLSIIHYQKKGRIHFLILAGLLSGLSVITRYVGISLGIALCLWILFFGKGNIKKRCLDLVILGILSLLPVVVFFIHNAILGVVITGRATLVFQTFSKENYAELILAFNSWFFPGINNLLPWFFKKVLFFGLVLSSTVLFFFSVRHSHQTENDDQRLLTHFEYLALFYLIIYGLTFMGSTYLSITTWTASQIPRYLVPIYPVFIILVVLIFLRVHPAISGRSKVFGGVAICLGFAILGLYIYNFSTLYKKGINLGYTDIKNNFPALVNELKSIDPNRPLIASNYELITFLAGRPAYSMPEETDVLTGITNPNLPQMLAKITDLINHKGVLAVFRTSPDETFYFDSMIKNMTLLGNYGNGWISISLYTKPSEGE